MIHIKELYRLQNIKHLRLVAGEAGLERTVTAAVLFEYDPSRMKLADFYRGDLVVTTLAYARGDAQLMANSLLALMNQGIAGLLVKTMYFEKIPQDVLSLADSLGTPLFLFDETYIEEVILEVTELIRGKRHFAGFEKELDALMRGGLTDEQLREKLARIDPAGSDAYRVAALFPRERMPRLDERLYTLLTEDFEAGRRYICMEWRRMLLVLIRMSAKDERHNEIAQQEMDSLLSRAGVMRQLMHVGLSDAYTERTAFGSALGEAVYAARAARLKGKETLFAGDLGLYAYLLPISQNTFARQWCKRSLKNIRDYDAQNKTNLETTARALFQHPNTVRYRLTKIQKLMQMEDTSMFLPMLSLTVQLSTILEEEERR